MKNKAGRPKLPKGQAKTASMVGVRFEPDLDKKIDKKIEESGVPQSKAQWVREAARAIAEEWVTCTDWTVEDLDCKRVHFKIRDHLLGAIEGHGKFIVWQRGDGSMKIKIESHYDNDARNEWRQFFMPQASVGWIKKVSGHPQIDFAVIDPTL